MRKRILYLILLFCLSFSPLMSYAQNHFLKDEAYRDRVHQQFLKRKKMAAERNEILFGVFEKEKMTEEEKQALEFLFAYMPLSDLADYNGNFFLGQIRSAFKARDYFDWGKTIPDDIFRHFVLVYRVNNEDLDNSRDVFFDELKDRVKGMSMEQAALEVNHWCHEKVTYRGTDGRTSAPLALMKTSWGRCGEESTFTTAAMRAVGIPARQCYTPRWAHTDDNHAWVEVWIDGEWHYIGACEPEPELDVAWFTAPAKRAMMVHTNVFGPYDGKEEKNYESELYSVINLLPNYTDTRKATVQILDKHSQPVEGATVTFNVYNYAEFYPVATVKTDSKGMASITTGYGDVFIQATDGNNFGYIKSEPNDPGSMLLLIGTEGNEFSETFVMNAPVPQAVKELDPAKVAANAVRFAYEDSVRNAYMKSFINERYVQILAMDMGLDMTRMSTLLQKAQGNWQDIACFITQKKDEPLMFPYLESITDKDLRDTPCHVLTEHFDMAKRMGVFSNVPDSLVAKYVYSPRIGRELIRPWRAQLQMKMNKTFMQDRVRVNQLVEYLETVKIDNEQNYYLCPVSPQGVDELRVSDESSLNILFVALCRSQGIAARIEPSTSRAQYLSGSGNWVNVNLTGEEDTNYPQASVTFHNVETNIVKPAYSTHYTIAKYENGDFKTLDFWGDKNLSTLPGTVQVDAGYYRLTIGSRANDGSVTVNTRYFTVNEGENKDLNIELPKTEGRIQVQGIVDPNSTVALNDGTTTSLKPLMNGKGLVIFFIDPGKEPSKHILQDIPGQREELDEWGGGVLFVIPGDKVSTAFDASVFKNLPKNSSWTTDKDRALLNAATGALQTEFGENFPLTVYLSSDGGILYSLQGYQIGIPENILKIIKAEEATKKSIR